METILLGNGIENDRAGMDSIRRDFCSGQVF